MRGITLLGLRRVWHVSIIILLAFISAAASIQKEDDWQKDLGREDHIAYIVLDQLQSTNNVDWTRGLAFDDFKIGLSTFFEKFNWAPNNCWAGSVYKEGVKAYCLPYARLGKYYQNPHDPNDKVFNTIGACAGLYVWHIPRENSFYLWGSCWNVSGAMGPFRGNPRIELRQAVKPRRGQRSFPGVALTVVSQRWVYPDAKDARVPRDEHYKCAHGHLSGSEVEMFRLNSFITRLRLTNNGPEDIYYQTEHAWADKPALCGLFDNPQEDWRQALKTGYQCDLAGQTWRKLARGGRVEFEKPDQAFAGGSVGFVILLNETPNPWDASKLLGTYPVMWGRK